MSDAWSERAELYRTSPVHLQGPDLDLIVIPHDECGVRERDEIYWPGEYLEKAIDHADPMGLAIILMHSHPGGLFAFSALSPFSLPR